MIIFFKSFYLFNSGCENCFVFVCNRNTV